MARYSGASQARFAGGSADGYPPSLIIAARVEGINHIEQLNVDDVIKIG